MSDYKFEWIDTIPDILHAQPVWYTESKRPKLNIIEHLEELKSILTNDDFNNYDKILITRIKIDSLIEKVKYYEL